MSISRLISVVSMLTLCAMLLPIQAWAADDIVVGFAIAQSGWMSAYDDPGTEMAKLFIDDTNAKGGLLGRKLRAVFADTKTDRAEGAKAGQEVLRQGADIMIGSCDYDFGSPALLQAQRAGKISFFLCAEDPKAGIIGIGPYSFTSSVAAQVSGATMAEWGAKQKGFKNAYVLLDDTLEFDKSFCAGFDWMFPKAGGMVVGRDVFKNDDASIASQVTRLRNDMRDEKVDVVVLCSYLPGGASAIRQMRAAGIDLPIVTSNAMDGTYWLDAFPSLTDFYVPVQGSVYGDEPRSDVNALLARFKATYGNMPVSTYAFPIYAALQLWGRAVEKAGTVDAAEVVKVMNTFKDEPTILGPRTYTDKLHIQDRAPLLIVEISHRSGKVVGEWDISEPVPTRLLYRLAN